MFKDTDNLLYEETFNDNYIVYTDSEDKKKHFMKEFIGYNLNNNKYKIKFDLVDTNGIYKKRFSFTKNINYYENNSDFYIEIFLDFYNNDNQGRMEFNIYLNDILYDTVSFRYKYNAVNENNDLIKAYGSMGQYYIYLSKDIKLDKFFIHKIIFEKNNN